MDKRLAVAAGILIAVLLGVLAFNLVHITAEGGQSYEDFREPPTGDYTQVDPSSRIDAPTATHIDADLYADEDAYAYCDKGANHFGDFEHLVDAQFVSASDKGTHSCIWAVANVLDDAYDLWTTYDHIQVGFSKQPSSGELRIWLRAYDGGTQYSDYYSCSLGWYYFTIQRSGSTATCKIYSDSSRTTLVYTLSCTCPTTQFRYIYACSTLNMAASKHIVVDVEKLDLQERAIESPVEEASYIIYKVGSTYYAKNGMTGVIDYSSESANQVIQNAITALSGGGKILIKAGIYDISSPITLTQDISICGEGFETTEIRLTNPTIDGFVLDTNDKMIRISELAITSSVTKTEGTGIYLQNNLGVWIDQVHIMDQYRGMRLYGSSIYVNRVAVTDFKDVGILVEGLGNDMYFDQIIMNNEHVSPPPNNCLAIRHTDGLWIDNCDFMRAKRGVLIDPPTGYHVYNLFVSDSALGDLCTEAGMVITDIYGGDIASLYFTGCWWSSNGQHGIHIHGGDRITFVAPRFYSNNYAGLTFEDGTNIKATNIRILGGEAIENSKTGQNIYSGVEVGANVCEFSIIGLRSYGNYQQYGINIHEGAGNHFIITNCDLRGNIDIEGLRNDATGDDTFVTNNLPKP